MNRHLHHLPQVGIKKELSSFSSCRFPVRKLYIYIYIYREREIERERERWVQVTSGVTLMELHLLYRRFLIDPMVGKITLNDYFVSLPYL